MSSQRYISDTLKHKKNKVKKIKLYLTCFLVVSLLIGLIYLIRLSSIQISEVKISGNIFIETQEIKDKADKLLNSNILWIIPKKNIFIFSKKELEEQIKQNPAVVSVKIRKDFFNILTIEIKEQEKELIYCTSIERNECFYVNKTGFIYAKVKDFIIPEQEIIVYSDKEIKKIQDTIIEEEVYVSIINFIKNCALQNIKIGEIYIKDGGVVEFVTREKTKLITSLFDDFKKDFINLMALIDKEIIIKEQLYQIDYLDLRFGNKVFYKNRTN